MLKKAQKPGETHPNRGVFRRFQAQLRGLGLIQGCVRLGGKALEGIQAPIRGHRGGVGVEDPDDERIPAKTEQLFMSTAYF